MWSSRVRASLVAAAAAAGVLVIAGCGASTSESSPASTAVESVSPEQSDAASSESMDMDMDMDMGKEDGHSDGDHDHGDHDHGDHDHDASASAALSAEQDGYTLLLTTPSAPKGTADFTFTIAGPDGSTVTDFMVMHEKPMHLMVVSDDLKTYLHEHPVMDDKGLWKVSLPLGEAGSYRVVADFMPTDGPAIAVGETFTVGAPSARTPELTESRTATVDGYTAELVGDTLHEASAPLKVVIKKDGEPVTSVKPYLGAAAHFVAFGENLSYFHMHPNGDTISQSGELSFTAPPLDHMMYKGFVQVDVGGSLKTFEFVWKGE